MLAATLYLCRYLRCKLFDIAAICSFICTRPNSRWRYCLMILSSQLNIPKGQLSVSSLSVVLGKELANTLMEAERETVCVRLYWCEISLGKTSQITVTNWWEKKKIRGGSKRKSERLLAVTLPICRVTQLRILKTEIGCGSVRSAFLPRTAQTTASTFRAGTNRPHLFLSGYLTPHKVLKHWKLTQLKPSGSFQHGNNSQVPHPQILLKHTAIVATTSSVQGRLVVKQPTDLQLHLTHG